MNADAKAAVVAALRSGHYRQIRGRYEDGKGGYCVLGLIRHLRLDPGLKPRQRLEVMHMNDTLCLTFDEIADKIEGDEFEVSDRPPRHYSRNDLLAGERATGDVAAEIRARLDELLSRDAGRGPPPPPLPALIYVYPRRPVLTGAVGRRLVIA
ncbi:MAG: hypothetical protein ACREJ5_13065 [Geminicoccaceae bacterium]